jgi:hypothetical protein
MLTTTKTTERSGRGQLLTICLLLLIVLSPFQSAAALALASPKPDSSLSSSSSSHYAATAVVTTAPVAVVVTVTPRNTDMMELSSSSRRRRGFATTLATLLGGSTFLFGSFPQPALALKERNEMLCATGFFTNIAQYMCTEIGDISDEGRSQTFDKEDKELGSILDSLMGKMGVTPEQATVAAATTAVDEDVQPHQQQQERLPKNIKHVVGDKEKK